MTKSQTKDAKKNKPKINKNTKISKSNKKSKLNPDNLINKGLSIEISSILILCISVLLMISVYSSGGGFFGNFLGSLLKGLFGIGAYILPVIIIISCLSIFFSSEKKINIFKFVLSIIIFCILISLSHIISKDNTASFSNYFAYLSSKYTSGSFSNGGILGAILGDILLKTIGTTTSYIILTVLFIAIIFLLAGKSFFATLYKGIKKVSNYFYYEYSVKKEYEDEVNLGEKRNTILSIIKEKFNNYNSRKKNKKKKLYNDFDDFDDDDYDDDIYKERPFAKKLISRGYIQPNPLPPPQIRKYRDYIFEDGNTYKRIETPTFFNVKLAKQPSTTVFFAIDEINNPHKYKTQQNIKNDVIINTIQNDVPSNNTIQNDVPFNNTINDNKDLFNIKTKEHNYKPKPIPNLDIDLAREYQSVEDIFDVPPEQYLSSDTDFSTLNKLDDFYNFDATTDSENFDAPTDSENHTHNLTPKLNTINTINIDNSNIKNIDNDGYTVVQKKNDLVYDAPPITEEQDNSQPIIIKAEKEKMMTSSAEKKDPQTEYVFPKLSFLGKNYEAENDNINDLELRENSATLVRTLKSFNINTKVINISKGPSVTRYELSIEDGIKVSKILGLSDNLALSLAAESVRIEAPIPGKSAIGIEIPNTEIKSVFLSEVICSQKFQNFPSNLSFGLGKDITGNVIVTDISKMPHMLIAGATGSGKSVCINTLITSILYKSSPLDVRLMMIDPKVVELSIYNGIPHLLTPVVTDPEKAAGVLNWAVSEMMDRYEMFSKTSTRNLDGYNKICLKNEKAILPQIVIIIDELADLMMVAAKEVEASICRLAQLARAAGIHLIIATQRPSVDVITGLIKANIPSRIAFAVSSGTDSRTVLDTVGAEKLLGKGDMLFKAVDMNKPLRIQGAFISDEEVETIVSFIKENDAPNYDENIINKISHQSKNDDDTSDSDEITEEVISFLVKKGKASTSLVQRQFRIGYNRAARIIEELEDRGIISSESGSKQRDVLMDKYQYEEYQNRYNNY